MRIVLTLLVRDEIGIIILNLEYHFSQSIGRTIGADNESQEVYKNYGRLTSPVGALQ